MSAAAKSDLPIHRLHQPSLATNPSVVPVSGLPESLGSSPQPLPPPLPVLVHQPQPQPPSAQLIVVDGERCRTSRHDLEAAASHNVNVLLSSRQGTKYAADRIIGNGSFGVVYMATIPATGETVAIKKVLQDPKFKNRELQIMSLMAHPNAVRLRHCFYSRGDSGEANELYLNLVMDYVPDTLHKALRVYQKANKLMPLPMMKAYTYQLVRSLNYIHSMGVAHRDIKPQNLLLDSKRHHLLLCDCGSAKQLIRGEPNVAYICSRYYRAPELVFEATQYNCSIDMWSAGCVLGEMMMGAPLFPGESAVDQLIEIIKVLGTPSKEEIHAMNPSHTTFKFPQIKPHPWNKVFKGRAPAAAIDLIQRLLCYEPDKRLHPLDTMAHDFFDELREDGFMGGACEHLFDFTEAELRQMRDRRVVHKVVPRWLWRKYDITAQ